MWVLKPTLNLVRPPLIIWTPFSGSKKEAVDMLELAVKKNVRPIIQVLPSMFYPSDSRHHLIAYYVAVKEAGQAVRNLREGNVRYRTVLKYVSLVFLHVHRLMHDSRVDI
jgi:D-arabinose 1-dehydrogenase-like Zn-dependent alcohol dehydrogenase